MNTTNTIKDNMRKELALGEMSVIQEAVDLFSRQMAVMRHRLSLVAELPMTKPVEHREDRLAVQEVHHAV